VTDVGRLNHEDGSVSFVATLDVADALRADPEVLDTLEGAMRGAVGEITGTMPAAPRKPLRLRAYKVGKDAVAALWSHLLLVLIAAVLLGALAFFLKAMLVAVQFGWSLL
jgi:hypothetical protein